MTDNEDMAKEKQAGSQDLSPAENAAIPALTSEITGIKISTIVPKPPTKAQAAMKEEFRRRFFKESERHPVLLKLSKKERAAIKLGGRAAGVALERIRGPLTGKMVADVMLSFITQFVAVRESIVVAEPPHTEVVKSV